MLVLSPFFIDFMLVVGGIMIGSSVALMHTNYCKAVNEVEKNKKNNKKEQKQEQDDDMFIN